MTDMERYNRFHLEGLSLDGETQFLECFGRSKRGVLPSAIAAFLLDIQSFKTLDGHLQFLERAITSYIKNVKEFGRKTDFVVMGRFPASPSLRVQSPLSERVVGR